MANISSIKLPDGFTYDIKDNSKSTATNLLNGSQTGSLRTIGSAVEDSYYRIGAYAFAEGKDTKATGIYSHAEGYNTQSNGSRSRAEGSGTVASGDNSHAEGAGAVASGNNSHAESGGTASGIASHAEGSGTVASDDYSHAEGHQTQAGFEAHSEGAYTKATGNCSHAGGYETIAACRSQTVIGELNEQDPDTGYASERGKYAFVIGNGYEDYEEEEQIRSNALTVDWSGNGVFAGKITVGSAPTVNMDVATKKYVDDTVGVPIDVQVNGQSVVSGGVASIKVPIEQMPTTTGTYIPNDREPRDVGNYSLLVTDAIGMSLGDRALGIVSGYTLTCQSASAGTTIYRVDNNYANRIAAKCCENGYISKDEATSKVQSIEPVLSVLINGQTFTPDSSANSSSPIEITVANSVNPTETITSIRLFGKMNSYASLHLGNGISSGSNGRGLHLGGAVTKTAGNDNCMVGDRLFSSGHGNALFGRYHIARKNRGLLAGTGHDTTNARSEGASAVGEYSSIGASTLFAVGNGTSHTARSNAFEVDASGNVEIAGRLISASNDINSYFGCWNTSYCHIYTDAPQFAFNKAISMVAGGIGTSDYPCDSSYLKQGAYFYAKRSGSNQILAGTSSTGDAFFGYGFYSNSVGHTYFDGNIVHIRAKQTIDSNKAITNVSDKRFKTGRKPLGDTTNKLLLSLQPFEFKWDNDADGYEDSKEINFGLGAQDVEKAMENVGLNPKDYNLVGQPMEGYDKYTLSYTEFIPMLIHLCQTQQEEIDSLKNEINFLKTNVNK